MLNDSLQKRLKELRKNGKKVVLVTGVFDLLHAEHQRFLSAAAEIGDFLIVGLESDVRVRALKGAGRPLQDQATRLLQVQKLPEVGWALILPENFSDPAQREQLIAEVRPDYLAVSAHTDHQTEKARVLAKYGGELKVVLAHNPAISTSLLEKQLVHS